MDSSNSLLVNPSTYRSDMDGLCADVPLRVHRTPESADRGALRAQKEWKDAFGSLPPRFAGTMGPEYNFVSISVPETLPDRLELVAYIVEVAFLLDDMMDTAESPLAVAELYTGDMLRARQLIFSSQEVDLKTLSPVTRMAVGMGRAMVSTDPKGADVAFRFFGKWAQNFMGGKRSKEFANFDEYLKHRGVDFSAEAQYGLFQFAMALDIPKDQQQICLELSQPMWLQMALANDLHSWAREHKTALNYNEESVTNAIWVLTEKHGMSLSQAKAVCRQRAKGYAAKYMQVLETLDKRDNLCNDAKYLLNVLQFCMSGNVVWGLQCLRYNPDRKFNHAQLEMRRAISADDTMSWGHDRPKPAKGAVENPEAPLAVRLEDDRKKPDNHINQHDISIVREVPNLSVKTLEAPSRYLDSLPAKGIRDMAIDALNEWFRVPEHEITLIKRVINLLHGASLILDDIQDGSLLRRGKPATHVVFGLAQAINSGGFRYLEALKDARKLGGRCMDIFCAELQHLYVGQSHDLAWTCNLECPTEDEYLAMVDAKTAGLFRMLARMLDAKSGSLTKPSVTTLTRFMTLLGRLFQIRDDYMNLTSADYTKQKGFCEDLDEGKYSLPLLHALGRAGDSNVSKVDPEDVLLLRNMLAQRHMAGKMSLDQKRLFLQHLEARGSLKYTQRAVDALQAKLNGLAEEMGFLDNDMLRRLLEVLKV